MRTLGRYIARWVLGGTLLALAVLLALFTVFALLDELGDVGKGRYGLGEAAIYLALTTPRRVYELVPLATLLGSLLGLGVLAGHSELTVIRAAGVSSWRIAFAALRATAVIVIAAVLLGELVVPHADDAAEARRSIAMTSSIALKTRYGFWARDGQRFINVRQILPDRRLGAVYAYTFDGERRLRSAMRAERARPEEGSWVLEGVATSLLADDRVERRVHDSLRWEAPLASDLVELAVLRPDRLSSPDLLRYVSFLRANGQDAAPYELALWSKLMVPISALGLALLAVPFVFGPLRSAGVGQRVLAGASIGITFYIASQALAQVGLVYGLAPVIGATFPTAVVVLLSILLLRRAG